MPRLWQCRRSSAACEAALAASPGGATAAANRIFVTSRREIFIQNPLVDFKDGDKCIPRCRNKLALWVPPSPPVPENRAWFDLGNPSPYLLTTNCSVRLEHQLYCELS